MLRLAIYSYSRVLVVWVVWILRTALRVLVLREVLIPRRTLALPQSKRLALPSELIDVILEFYLELTILHSQRSIRDYRIRRKEFLSDIARLKLCSRDFCTRVDNQMSTIWPHWALSGPCSKASKPGSPTAIQYNPDVRIITADVCSCCLPQGANLTIYAMLERVSLNCHNALTYDPLGNMLSLLPFNRVVALPHFLTQLEVVLSHRPVDQIIELVTSACPGLVELRIVRCTMFNKPDCWWWRQHWHDADHNYMQDHVPQNVVGYAHTLAGSLHGLKKLQTFHIGHYMTHINAVMDHRTNHKKHHPSGLRDSLSHVEGIAFHNELHLQAMQAQDGGPPIDPNSIALAKRELWKAPCPQCEQLKTPIEVTERWVASILASRLESIRTVSFPSFLSEKRTNPSPWDVQREIKSAPGKKWGVVEKVQAAYRYPIGAKMRVRTKTPGSLNFDTPHEFIFDNVHGEWQGMFHW